MARLRVFGSGTSHGVPQPNCHCVVCTSSDPCDYRTRSSILLELNLGVNILIDCGPDFRSQALSAGLTHVEHLLFTHGHCDHIHGFPELVRLCKNRTLHVHLSQYVLEIVSNRFTGILNSNLKCMIEFHVFDGPFEIEGIQIVPIPMKHGVLDTHGFRIWSTAYLTDCNFIPESSYPLLRHLDCLIIDGLWRSRHATHFSFHEAVQEIAKIQPKRGFLTHIACGTLHVDIQRFLDGQRATFPALNDIPISPLVDAMEFEIEEATETEMPGPSD
jgi:phosphoribosyl 1,2-cyclic phosphate phosphodiesterase